MSENKLIAMPRSEKGYKVRRGDNVPGVLYGKSIDTVSVQFNKNDLSKIIRKYGDRARIKVIFNDKENLGIFKEVARDVISREIFHLDVQVVDLEEKLTLTVPIIVHGIEALSAKKLVLQQNLMEIQLSGRLDLIPDRIEIDVSDFEDGDTKTIEEIEFPEGVECLEELDALILGARIPRIDEEEEEEEDEELLDGEEVEEEGEEGESAEEEAESEE